MGPIKLVSDPVDKGDIDALCKWLQQTPTPQLSKGPLTLEFEKAWAKAVGRKHSLMVNSGSSANYLLFSALKINGYLEDGSKVVIPALCWATSLAPCFQLNLQPILCDINLTDLSADLNHLEEIFKTQKPKAFLLVPILGLVPNMQAIVELCAMYGVKLLIDSCESAGSKFNGRFLEDFGLISTSSHYIGHQIVAIESGSVSTSDDELYDTLRLLRAHGWSRELSDEKRKAYREKYNLSKFNELYTFFIPAYNFRSTDLNAFIGLRHIAIMDDIINARNRNFLLYNKYLKTEWKPVQNENCFVSNLGYPVIHENRDEIAEALRGNNVECRPLVSGSMGKQPFWVDRYGVTPLKNADYVTENGMYIPNHPLLTEEEIKYVCELINGKL